MLPRARGHQLPAAAGEAEMRGARRARGSVVGRVRGSGEGGLEPEPLNHDIPYLPVNYIFTNTIVMYFVLLMYFKA